MSYLALPMIAAAVALIVGSPVLWWLAPVGSVIGAATGAIYGVVQAGTLAPGALRARVITILAGAVVVVVAAMMWLPSRW